MEFWSRQSFPRIPIVLTHLFGRLHVGNLHVGNLLCPFNKFTSLYQERPSIPSARLIKKTGVQENKLHIQTLNAVVLCSSLQILSFIANEQNEEPLFF